MHVGFPPCVIILLPVTFLGIRIFDYVVLWTIERVVYFYSIQLVLIHCHC